MIFHSLETKTEPQIRVFLLWMLIFTYVRHHLSSHIAQPSSFRVLLHHERLCAGKDPNLWDELAQNDSK